MNEELKTIKELANELGISKQAVRRYFDQLPSSLIPTKEKGSYRINADVQKFIKDKVSSSKDNLESSVDSNVDTLKDRIIMDKDKQIDDLKQQVKQLGKLLDQQQQLHLKTQQMLEEKTKLLETEQRKKWWRFW